MVIMDALELWHAPSPSGRKREGDEKREKEMTPRKRWQREWGNRLVWPSRDGKRNESVHPSPLYSAWQKKGIEI